MANTLNAHLVANLLTSEPNDYWISVLHNGSAGPQDLAKFIIDDGIELNIATLIDVITRYNAKAATLAASGVNVNTGLTYLRASVKGNIYDQNWNAKTNPVQIVSTPAPLLRKAAAETTVRILGMKSEAIELISVTDLSTQLSDGSLTRGRVAELRGTNIKIAGDGDAPGVYLRYAETGNVFRFDTADIAVNDPSRLLLQIPATAPEGEATLTVTTQYGSNRKLLKEARSTVLPLPVFIA